VKKSTLDIYLNDKFVGKTTLDDKIVLKKETEAVYGVVLNADTKSIMKAAMGSLGGFLKGKVDIRLKGKVKGSVYGISKSVDVDMTEQINLKEFL
jgi:LEA14-like dessication related protein